MRGSDADSPSTAACLSANGGGAAAFVMMGTYPLSPARTPGGRKILHEGYFRTVVTEQTWFSGRSLLAPSPHSDGPPPIVEQPRLVRRQHHGAGLACQHVEDAPGKRGVQGR